MIDPARPRHPLPGGTAITPPDQQPNADPSLAVRNNGGRAPSVEPAPAGRREALLVLSFGGPEGTDDVLPFLENVTRGRGIPRERLAAVAEHYHPFGGVSPINEQNLALVEAVRADLAGAGLDLPVYWGNRNWAPYVEDTWRQMAEDGIEHAYVFATSAYASFSGCRQYHEDVARARVALAADPAAPAGPTAEKLPHYFDQPGFLQANAEALAAALARLPAGLRDGARLVATAHSIPTAMAAV
ncbi:MAG: hemH, partial [Modestobacter sp.]|nr:hemH [Modestobacter sp.]